MNLSMTEEQQIELLKNGWNKYGNFIISIFIFIILISIGWHYWVKHQEIKLERGSVHYERLLDAVVNDQPGIALKKAYLLKNNYSHTPYGALAELILARQKTEQHDYLSAESALHWDMTHANTDSLRQVARLRLARVYIQEKKFDQALAVLNKINNKQFKPIVNETFGDVYVALNNKNKAHEYYQQAADALGMQSSARPLLLMKLNDLAV